jgi:hypothetical protein
MKPSRYPVPVPITIWKYHTHTHNLILNSSMIWYGRNMGFNGQFSQQSKKKEKENLNTSSPLFAERDEQAEGGA